MPEFGMPQNKWLVSFSLAVPILPLILSYTAPHAESATCPRAVAQHMDKTLQPVIEMNEWIWNRFKDDLKDASPEEINWRPLPQANTINAILRHLRIEAQWHLASLEHVEPMQAQVTANVQQEIDLTPLDFERNLKELEQLYTSFIATLRRTTLPALQQQTVLAYRNVAGEASRPTHLLGFHQAVHLASHWGQIRTIRNLYRKTRGEPARFFPENPTFPIDNG